MMERESQELPQASPLLATKFFVPRPRREAVKRPRLIQRLERGASSKLVLVSAPPGFGKTTVVAEWLASRDDNGSALAWVSLDSNDNQPETFWTYLVHAIHAAAPGAGGAAVQMLQAQPQGPIEAVLTSLINDITTMRGELTFVLDDLHVITSPAIAAGLAFLLDHLPPNAHMVIISRADPVLPLSRLRARSQLAEIRAADLRFTPEEAAAFLNGVMGLELVPERIAALESRTEGWIAALQLAALSMQGHGDVATFIGAFAGDDRYIVDYLVDEVLQRQPENVRVFLLQTSILDRLSAPLCETITGQAGAKAMLETLDRGNLFLVPLDDKRQWFRYHHLFAEVLRANLESEKPDLLPVLHRRASDWYHQAGEPAQAIRHAFAAMDFERAADLVELVMPEMRKTRQEVTLLRWLKTLPEEPVRRRPVLETGFAGVELACGELDRVEERLAIAERWLTRANGADPGDEASGGMTVADRAAFEGLRQWIAIYRAGLAQLRGQWDITVQQARLALSLVPSEDHLGTGAASALLGLALWATGELDEAYRIYAAAMERVKSAGFVPDVIVSTLALAEMRLSQGRCREALTSYNRALQFAAGFGEPPPLGTADLHVGVSEIFRERDDLATAIDHLRTARQLGDGASLPEHRFRWYVAMARLEQAQGDTDAALELLDIAEHMQAEGFYPTFRPIPALRARLLLAQGRVDEALDWGRERQVTIEDEPAYLREFEHLTLVRALLAQACRDGRPEAFPSLTAFLQRLFHAAESGHRTGSAIEILVLQALVCHAAGDMTAAQGPLGRALALAEPEGYARVFLDDGRPMRELLRTAVAVGVGGTYAENLLARLEPARASVPAAATPAAAKSDLLTARELEILTLVAAGMQNLEIADHLVISIATVKRHIANIYVKFDVGNRTAAVARATELGLI